MNKLIITILTLLMLAGCSNTNKYDVEVAKARYEYGKTINEQKPMFEIKGEIRCSEAQISKGECGLVVYDQNQRYINVEPKQTDYYATTLNFAGKLINPLFNWKVAQSNNDLSKTLAEQNTELFSTMFTSVADIKGSGTNYNYTDSYNTSDSYNSQDTSNVDSLNTSTETSSVVTTDTSNTSTSTSSNSTSNIDDSYNSESEVTTEANDNKTNP